MIVCAPSTQATPKVSLTPEELDALTKRTQDGGTEVVQAKAGKVRLMVGELGVGCGAVGKLSRR